MRLTDETIYFNGVKTVKGIFAGLSADKRLDYPSVLTLAESVYLCIEKGPQLFKIINEEHEIRDATYHHSFNTAFYSMFIGKWLDFPVNEIKKVILSGLLHDIGKSKIPDAIINKKGPLSDQEMQIMQSHPALGYKMICQMAEIDAEVKEAVLLHHKRLDGSGYPEKIMAADRDLGLCARIVAFADVFDAMTQDRTYKEKVSPFKAFEMFRSIGYRLFDKEIIDIFLLNIPIFYTKIV